MTPLRLRLMLLLGAVIAGMSLPSCITGNVKQLHRAKTGAIGFGSTGNHPDDHFWPQFGKGDPEATAVHQAICEGIEKALMDHPAFDYVPFDQMRDVPFRITNSAHKHAVKKFAKVNGLEVVIRIRVLAHMRNQGVYVGFLINDREGRSIAMSNANGHGDVPFQRKALTAPSSLPGWKKTAYDVTLQALAKVGG